MNNILTFLSLCMEHPFFCFFIGLPILTLLIKVSIFLIGLPFVILESLLESWRKK